MLVDLEPGKSTPAALTWSVRQSHGIRLLDALFISCMNAFLWLDYRYVGGNGLLPYNLDTICT